MTESPGITGIHHVTAIASDPQPNLDFYVRFLGLRLVKRTVNFDNPTTYHFYYGDETGQPGSILTFFPWPGARAGRHGTGQVTLTSFSVPSGAIEYWKERAERHSIQASSQPERFGDPVLHLKDPDGLAIELIASASPTPGDRPDGVDIPSEFEIQRIHSATLALQNADRTSELLTGIMGLRELTRDGDRIRFEAAEGGPGNIVDLLVQPGEARGAGGAGTVHHIAFRTPDDAWQLRWLETLTKQQFHVSPVMDRQYFHSIYYREPGGILFEIATDPPGFLIDESAEELGTSLKLPPEYEPARDRIEAALQPITVPTTGLMTESY